MTSLTEAAVQALCAAEPQDKVRLTLQTARRWRDGEITKIGDTPPPARPGRPARPEILPPRNMPRRGTTGLAGRIALIHALTHIEFNAIDLAWDIIARFSGQNLPKGFYDDWVLVAEQEAEHFVALDQLLRANDAQYGSLPAHDGLWQSAEQTEGDLRCRLAVVPMTLEARALDTAPVSIGKLDPATEAATIAVLTKIVEEEIDHVAAGVRWFDFLCNRSGDDPAEIYQRIVGRHFPKGLKRPFNTEARNRAGLSAHYYEPLAEDR